MTATVMVIDDDPGIQATVSAILEFEGYDVVVAADGHDALERLDSIRPGLIILDLMMPRMDGYLFAEELGRRGLRGAIPIVVLTADAHAAAKAGQVGADGYLEKPFTLDGLLDEVHRVLGYPSGLA